MSKLLEMVGVIGQKTAIVCMQATRYGCDGEWRGYETFTSLLFTIVSSGCFCSGSARPLRSRWLYLL